MLRTMVAVVALTIQGDAPKGSVTNVDRLLAQERFVEAATAARQLVAAFPTLAEAHAVAGDATGALAGRSNIIRMFGLARECRQHYELATRLDARNLRALEGLAGYLAQAPGIVGGNRDSAFRVVDLLERLHKPRGVLARALLMTREQRSSSIDSLVNSVVTEDGDSLVLGRAAEYFTARGQHDRALRLRLDRLSADIGSPSRWYDVARSRLAVGDTGAALRDLEASWQRTRAQGDTAWIVPSRPAWRLSELLVAMARSTEARAWIDSVLVVDPTHARARRTRDSLDKRG